MNEGFVGFAVCWRGLKAYFKLVTEEADNGGLFGVGENLELYDGPGFMFCYPTHMSCFHVV